MTPQSPARTTAAYAERLWLPWSMWLGALVVVAIVATEIMFSLPALPAWIPYAVLVPLTGAALLRAGRIRIEVAGGEFRVDDARLPLDVVSDVVALDEAGKREALGVGAHPLAFVIQRPWVGPAVQVLLDDPDDPTPYWVISTRRPVELATALLAAGSLPAPGPSDGAENPGD